MSRRRLPWTRQPQFPASIGALYGSIGTLGLWNHLSLNAPPLRKLRSAFVASSGGTMAANPTPHGVGVGGTAAAAFQYLTDAHLGIGSADYWMLVAFIAKGYVSFGSAFNTLANYGQGVGSAGAGLHITSANQLVGSMDGTATSATSAVLSASKLNTALLYSVGSTSNFYLNGVLVGTSTKASPSEISLTRLTVGADNQNSTTARTWNGSVLATAIGVGTLNGARAAKMTGDTWGAMFAPLQRRIWAPAAAAGGTFKPYFVNQGYGVIGAGVH